MIKKKILLFTLAVFQIIIVMIAAGCSKNETGFNVEESSLVYVNDTYIVVLNSNFDDDISILYEEKEK